MIDAALIERPALSATDSTAMLAGAPPGGPSSCREACRHSVVGERAAAADISNRTTTICPPSHTKPSVRGPLSSYSRSWSASPDPIKDLRPDLLAPWLIGWGGRALMVWAELLGRLSRGG